MARRKPGEKRSQESRRPADSVSVALVQQGVSPHRFRAPRSVVFFALFCLYFAFGIDVRLIYHCGGLVDDFPCFYWGWDFLRDSLAVPGGAVEYLSALLAQSFYYSWLGAAVMTAKAWLLLACTDYVLKNLGVGHLRGLRFLGPLALLAVYSRYGFPFLTTLALLAALLGVCLYLRLRTTTDGRAVGWFLAIGLPLYAVAGGASHVFVVLCGLYELLVRRRLRVGVVQLACGAATPLVLGNLAYGVRLADAYWCLTPLSWELLGHSTFRIMLNAIWVLYLFLPVLVGAVGGWRLIFAGRGGLASSWGKTRVARVLSEDCRGKVGLNPPTLALVVVTAVVLLLARAPATKEVLVADYFSRYEMWDRLLDLGRRSPYRYTVCHAVDRALCRLDRLCDEMFCFPQQPEALLLTDRTAEPVWQKFDTCLDLGLINQAENALLMSTEIYGERPLLLHRLTRVNLVKGNVETARVYLEALTRVPFWGATARRDLARLQADPDLSEDEQIQHWRSIMLKADSVRNVDVLGQLLTENPANRTAYQYAVAFSLLSMDLDGFVRLFETYHQRSFSRIPRHLEEALLVFRTVKRQSLDAPGQAVSPEAKAQLQEFLQVFQQAGREKTAARSAIREKFGGTYYYYYFVGR
ncbi:MAG: hypothetical protein KBE65_18870 [Phycisphaerae bacterium]|nr:hypothetical protein [Phycisphaerae bacterium]